MTSPAAGGSEVLAYNQEPEQVQYHNQEVLDCKENQHLVEDFVVGHHSEPDHQERPVLNKQGLHNAPNVRAVFIQQGLVLQPLHSFTLWLRVHHWGEKIKVKISQICRKPVTNISFNNPEVHVCIKLTS